LCGATKHDVIDAGVAQGVAIAADRRRCRAIDHWVDRLQNGIGVQRIGLAVDAQTRQLFGLVNLKDIGRGLESGAVDMAAILADGGVALDQLRKGVGLELIEQIQALGPAEIVEPVSSLQCFHLVFEDIGEAGSKHRAKGHLLFSEAADPEIDGVEPAERATGIGSAPVEGRGGHCSPCH
jgi:hypothetical protein